MISTRSMAAAGIVEMSVTPEAFDGVERRPSTSTRLRFEPMPRSEIVAAPGVLVAVGWMSPPAVGVCAGTNCGSLLRLDSIAEVAELSSSASSAVTIGEVDSKSWRWMREPVTTMRPSSSTAQSAFDGSATQSTTCAAAGVAIANVPAQPASNRALYTPIWFRFLTSCSLHKNCRRHVCRCGESNRYREEAHDPGA